MKTSPLVLRFLLGLGLLLIAQWLMPANTELWRKVLVSVLSVTLGYHIAAASSSPFANGRVWLECLAFPMLMLGFLCVPAPMGWVLLVTGFFWRLILVRVL